MFNLKSFINYPAVRFKKFDLLTLEDVKNVFKLEEDKNLKLRAEILDAWLNDDYDKIAKLGGNDGFYFADFVIKNIICDFTKNDSNLESLKSVLLDLINENKDYLKGFEISENELKIQTCYNEIHARKLSAFLPNLLLSFPDLENSNREQRCHEMCYKAMLTLNFGKSVDMATGYISRFSKDIKFLHSWLEFEGKYGPTVVDFTENLICNKKGYYQFQNIASNVHKIPQKTLIEEEDIMYYLSTKDCWLSKLYFANRPLALKMYKKLKSQDELQNLNDPLYQAAKTMYNGFKKASKKPKKTFKGKLLE